MNSDKLDKILKLTLEFARGNGVNCVEYDSQGLDVDNLMTPFTLFIELEWPLSTMVRDLPAGVLQQVSLVAATLHDPEIVFLDEPTAGVTPHARFKFWELIKALRDKGKTVFVTTHYMDEAEQCGRVALMRSGELIALDSPNGLKERTFPNPIYEITPSKAAPPNWRSEAISKGIATAIETFGMRDHAETASAGGFESYFKGLTGFWYWARTLLTTPLSSATRSALCASVASSKSTSFSRAILSCADSFA